MSNIMIIALVVVNYLVIGKKPKWEIYSIIIYILCIIALLRNIFLK